MNPGERKIFEVRTSRHTPWTRWDGKYEDGRFFASNTHAYRLKRQLLKLMDTRLGKIARAQWLGLRTR